MAVVMIRDPVEVYKSIVHLLCTSTLTQRLKNPATDFMPELRPGYHRLHMVYKEAYSYWMEAAKEKKFPVYFVKYEDYCANPTENLIDTFRFLMGEENLEGTYIEERIKKATSGKPQEPRAKE